MSEIASLLYGAAQAPAQPAEQPAIDERSLADALFDSTDPVATRAVADAVDHGAVLPADADTVARTLDRELRAVGLHTADAASLLRTIGQPAPEGVSAQRAVGEANKALHAAFGADGQRLMVEADKWLATVAPGIHGSLAGTRASIDAATIVNVVRAYQRAKRK